MVSPDFGPALSAPLVKSTRRTSSVAEDLGAGVAYTVGARHDSATPAESFGLVPEDGNARVVLEIEKGSASTLSDSIRAMGGRVEIEQPSVIQASVRTAAITSLATDPHVIRIRPPAVFVPAAISGEGVVATNASEWQPHGLAGSGVKIAVFDSGFAGLTERQAAGEIPALAGSADFCNGAFNGPDDHGTAVAEIVAEQAPGAQLYLVCIDTDVSLALAEIYAKANGVKIVNLSGGFYNSWRGDGTGPAGTPDGVVADARANGILWVNAAGNDAFGHWDGTFVSADGDAFHEFAPGDEGNSIYVPNGNVVCGFLRWDQWPAATDDFDLGFYDEELGQFIDWSEIDQSVGGVEPTEGLCIQNVSGAGRVAAFFIYRYSGSGTPSFDLFTYGFPYGLQFQYATAARSVVDPGASPNVLTAGAACWQSGALEPYSSQGPTIDGRVKPDLVAPDSVSGVTYGPFMACGASGFAGTSASAPHVAGAAALLAQRYPTLGPDDLQKWLTANASDLGVPGPDNQHGAGKLVLTTLPQALVKAIAAKGSYAKAVKLQFRLLGAQWELRNHVHVFRGSKQIRAFDLPFRLSPDGSLQTVTWKAGRAVPKSTFKFCVEAWDKAGHESKRSCARIALR